MAKLYFRYGAMNCGKTTHLLQVAHNYQETGLSVLILKPSCDTKGEEKIVSRLGISRKVNYLIGENDNVLETIKNDMKTSCILVDEAQFLTPKQIDELYEITKDYNIPIICYGLRCDFQMNAFPGASRLLQISDSIEEMKTICKCGCGKKATHNMRLVNNVPTFSGEQVLIDGAEDNITYEAVCGDFYIKTKKKILYKK